MFSEGVVNRVKGRQSSIGHLIGSQLGAELSWVARIFDSFLSRSSSYSCTVTLKETRPRNLSRSSSFWKPAPSSRHSTASSLFSCSLVSSSFTATSGWTYVA